MKKYLIVVTGLFFTGPLFSQKAHEGRVEYLKEKQDAIVINLPYPPEAVENALVSKMKKRGYKAKEEKGIFNKEKGFRIYKDAHISSISSSSMDILFKIDSKGKKDNEESELSMLLMKDDANILKTADSRTAGNAKEFLDDLVGDAATEHLDLQIKDKESLIAAAEKKQKGLEGDLDDMEKKARKLQEDIESNRKNQDKQREEITSLRNALDVLKGKRKAN